MLLGSGFFLGEGAGAAGGTGGAGVQRREPRIGQGAREKGREIHFAEKKKWQIIIGERRGNHLVWIF